MRFLPTGLPGVTMVEPEPIGDARGHFARLYCPDEFACAGIDFVPTQTSLSFDRAPHTLRGMHYCLEPEGKLVRCTRGRIFDVVVDLRRDSATFRRWFAIELDPVRARALHIPSGVAHGFLSLEPDTDVLYRSTVAIGPVSTPACAGTIRNSSSIGRPPLRSSIRATGIIQTLSEPSLCRPRNRAGGRPAACVPTSSRRRPRSPAWRGRCRTTDGCRDGARASAAGPQAARRARQAQGERLVVRQRAGDQLGQPDGAQQAAGHPARECRPGAGQTGTPAHSASAAVTWAL